MRTRRLFVGLALLAGAVVAGQGCTAGKVGGGPSGTGGGAVESCAKKCPPTGTDCVTAFCDDSGACATANAIAGLACDDGPGGVCDGKGKCVDCLVDSNCPAAPHECVEAKCSAGQTCSLVNVKAGAALKLQLGGDCKRIVCDGSGSTKVESDDNDPGNDLNDCTQDTCYAGEQKTTKIAGPCFANGGKLCGDPNGPNGGKCVECNSTSDCVQPSVCDPSGSGKCVPPTCTDKLKDGDETDVDCGGKYCAPCSDTLKCKAGSDCASKVCDGTCQKATCGDKTVNQDETDQDCGGNTCGPCGDKLKCKAAGDCTSKVCAGNPLVCQAPSCADDVQNGQETDKDCGSACIGKLCANTLKCKSLADCQSGFCQGGTTCAACVGHGDCAALAHCTNGVCVPDKAQGESCTFAEQCATGNCRDSICCDKPCTGVCEACNGAKLGVCEPVASEKYDVDTCAPSKVCDGAKNCVECVSGAQCAGAKPVCKSATKTCVECVTNTDCANKAGTTACNTSSNTCAAAYQEPCQNGGQCESGICLATNKCGCADDGDCKPGDSCNLVSNVCVSTT